MEIDQLPLIAVLNRGSDGCLSPYTCIDPEHPSYRLDDVAESEASIESGIVMEKPFSYL